MIKSKKGITLIALIITVIILLILAGVAISIAVNGENLFGKAADAKDSWNAKVQEEENVLEKYTKMLNQIPTKVTDTDPGALEGTGSENDPWTINSIEDLVAFAYNVNTNTNYTNGYVKLGLTLDFNSNDSYCNPEAKYIADGEKGYTPSESGTPIKELLTGRTGIGFIPIGSDTDKEFSGVFDGNNSSINNLYVNQPDSYGVGLFGKCLTNSIEVKNLGIVSCDLTGMVTGGIIGQKMRADTILTNCYSTGKISGTNYAGGLVGTLIHSVPKITNCYNEADVEGGSYTGGIIGSALGYTDNEEASALISGCHNSGKINSDKSGNDIHIGGIMGIYALDNPITITNCYNENNVSSTTAIGAGGILGYYSESTSSTKKTISNCHNSGNIKGYLGVGGLIGESFSEVIIEQAYNEGLISATDGRYIGGLMGYAEADATIKKCVNKGQLDQIRTSWSYYAGGFIGFIEGDTLIEDSHNEANLTASYQDLGGLAGFCRGNLTVINCYNTGNITGYVREGGLVCGCDGTAKLYNCYNTGNVGDTLTGYSSNPAAGIICSAGENGVIYNCYNIGNISGYANSYGIGYAGTIKNCYNIGDISCRYNYGSSTGIGNSGSSIANCYNRGNISSVDTMYSSETVAGISTYCENLTNCHNSGNITSPSSRKAELTVDYELDGTGCTYLYRTNNVAAHGATEIRTSDNSFTNSMITLLNAMNSFVNENNSNASNVKLKTWELGSDGYPVWSE